MSKHSMAQWARTWSKPILLLCQVVTVSVLSLTLSFNRHTAPTTHSGTYIMSGRDLTPKQHKHHMSSRQRSVHNIYFQNTMHIISICHNTLNHQLFTLIHRCENTCSWHRLNSSPISICGPPNLSYCFIVIFHISCSSHWLDDGTQCSQMFNIWCALSQKGHTGYIVHHIWYIYIYTRNIFKLFLIS